MYNIFDKDYPAHHDDIFDKDYPVHHKEHEVLPQSSLSDKVIEKLEGKLHDVSGLLKETREWLIESQKLHKRCADNAVKVIRHQKYKRCLAMASYWGLVSALVHGETQLKCMRRELKWHKLAEKFKPNKDAE